MSKRNTEEEKKMYANTNRQELDKHCFAVGCRAYLLAKSICPNDEELQKVAFVAGILHDIGKMDKKYQKWIKAKIKNKKKMKKNVKNYFNKYLRHNEITLLIFHLFCDINNEFSEKFIITRKIIKHVIYYHHTIPKRKEEFKFKNIYEKFFSKNGKDDCERNLKNFYDSINKFQKEYENCPSFKDLIEIKSKNYEIDILLPEYKDYSCSLVKDNVEYNARLNLLRFIVISSDRTISSLNNEEFENLFNNEEEFEKFFYKKFKEDDKKTKLSERIEDGFKKIRENKVNEIWSKKQLDVSLQLSEKDDISVLGGPPGCGKTLISLLVGSNKKANKIMFIFPRVLPARGIYDGLKEKEYHLYDTKIEIKTSEYHSIYFKKDDKTEAEEKETDENNEFSGDIIITTIDQMIDSVITHKNIDRLSIFLESFVIFDEFHEYIENSLLISFLELVKCKSLLEVKNVLLVSATPNPVFLEEKFNIREKKETDSSGREVTSFRYLNRKMNSNIVNMPSFNKNEFKIILNDYNENKKDDSNPFYKSRDNDEFHLIINNMALTAQESRIRNSQEEKTLALCSPPYRRLRSENTDNEIDHICSPPYRRFRRIIQLSNRSTSGSPPYRRLRSLFAGNCLD